MSLELAHSEMEQILLQDPHMIAIVYPKQRVTPGVDFYNFSPPQAEILAPSIGVLGDHVNMSYFVDDFETDHDSRRKWRSRLMRTYDWFFDFYSENDALRAARLTTMRTVVDEIGQWYEGIHQTELGMLVHEFRSIYDSKNFATLSTEQKIGHVGRLQKQAFNVLELLSKPAGKF